MPQRPLEPKFGFGDIRTENVVNAGGYRCNEVGAMLGVTHPVVSMEHMYFLTDTMPELEALDFRVPIIRDPGDDFYSRQEKQGLLVGVFHNEDDAHAYRIKLEKEEELRQIGKSA